MSSKTSFLPSIVLGMISVVTTGCGDQVQYVDVQGLVTINGKAAEGIYVTFEPIDRKAQPSTGRTDAAGQFSLASRVDGRSGAAVGRHRVTMTSVPPDAEGGDERTPIPPERVPMKFRDGSQLFEVKADENVEAKFSL